MKLLPWICLAACAGPPRRPTIAGEVGDKLVDAIKAHDVETVVRFLHAPVPFGGLWFDDAACRAMFPSETNIRADQLRAFASCLVMLPIERSPRKHELDDVAVLQYAPGIEVEVEFLAAHGVAWIGWIGYANQRAPKDALPTITGAAFDALRIDPKPLALDPATQSALDAGRHKVPAQYAWLKVCIDATGAVTGVHARSVTSPLAASVFVGAAKTWRFRPFELGGQPIPVCALKRLTYPDRTDNEVLPIATLPGSSDAPRIVLVELELREGQLAESPDQAGKRRMRQAGVSRIYAAVDVCFDATGKVTDVHTLTPSGLPDYDAMLLANALHWRFEPVLDNGVPIATCAIAKYVYDQ